MQLQHLGLHASLERDTPVLLGDVGGDDVAARLWLHLLDDQGVLLGGQLRQRRRGWREAPALILALGGQQHAKQWAGAELHVESVAVELGDGADLEPVAPSVLVRVAEPYVNGVAECWLLRRRVVAGWLRVADDTRRRRRIRELRGEVRAGSASSRELAVEFGLPGARILELRGELCVRGDELRVLGLLLRVVPRRVFRVSPLLLRVGHRGAHARRAAGPAPRRTGGVLRQRGLLCATGGAV